EMAGKLAGKSLAVLALGKRAFATAEDLPLPAALEHLASQLSLNVLAEDASEGVTAFLEKREPHWKDR
ncbi:MAG TPA: crotonase, partial [Myxococcales bacterium]|nr:crotonase [Myxococcales bacterium]